MARCVSCMRCGTQVSNEMPEEVIVRAFVECPECLEKANYGEDIDDMARMCHAANERWWKNLTTGEPITTDQPHLVGEKLMLIVSEIAEAMEGHRKNLDDAHLPVFKSVEVELADAMIRIFDLSAAMGLRLGEAFVAKMAYNAVREDHTDAARRADGGKKY